MFGQNNPIYSQIPQASVPGVTPEMQMVAQQQAAAPHHGMFGGGSINLGAALAGYLAGSGNPAGRDMLQMSNERNRMAYEEQLYEHRQNLEMQRQMAMLPIQARLKLMYPDGDFAQTEVQAGVVPGSAQWTKDFQTHQQNTLDPMTTIPGGGMAPASVARAMLGGGAGQPAPSGVTFTPIDPPHATGGQTQPASGGFLGSGDFSNIGPYKRF